MEIACNPIMVESWRGQTLESFHRGVVCMVDEKKEVIFAKGNIHQLCFPRSALKFFQHFPLIESGAFESFGFTLEELAIMCGSHNGEIAHQEMVTRILNKIGLDESALRCGPQMPTLKKDSSELLRQGKNPSPLMNNCSGKHAGFLALAVYHGWDTETYWKPEHPAQLLIRQTVAEIHEVHPNSFDIALDGCSAPIFSLSVFQQALGFMKLASGKWFTPGQEKARDMIMNAVTQFPFMVAGTQRYCTEMMMAYRGKVAGKTGADGIYSMALPEYNVGITIKIDDGKMHPQYLVAQNMLDALGMVPDDSPSINRYQKEMQKNFNRFDTGWLKVPDELFNDLQLLVKS